MQQYSPGQPAKIEPLEFKINADAWQGSKSNLLAARRLTPQMQDVVTKTVSQLLQLGVIEASNELRASQVLLVPKPGGKWRLCVDYRELNSMLNYMLHKQGTI